MKSGSRISTLKIISNNSFKQETTKNTKFKIGWDAIIYAVYCAIIPLNMVLNYTGLTVNRYIGILAAICICCHLLIKKKVYFYTQLILLFVFYVWASLTYFWSIQQNTTISQLITLSSLIGLCIVSSMRGFNEYEILLIKNFMVGISAVLVFYLVPNQDVSYTRGTITTSAGSADQNGLAANILFALWMAIDLFIQYKKRKIRWIYLITIILMLTSIFLIASRGTILALAISGAVYFFMLHRKKTKLRLIIFIICIIGIILFYVHEINPIVLERLSFKSMIEDQGSGRINIWKNIIILLMNNILYSIFGLGYGTEGFVSQYAIGFYIGIHNTFLEQWATVGIIGLVLLILLFISLFRTAKYRNDYLSIALIISLFVVCLFLGFFNNKGMWNTITLVIIGCQHKRTERNDYARILYKQ